MDTEPKSDLASDSLRDRVRNKLGSVIGLRPAWFDQQAWDERTPAERRMVRALHDRGPKAFTILRSAEMPLKNYTRETKI